MRKFRRFGFASSCAVVFLACAAISAQATPSKQIIIPSTDTQPSATVRLSVENFTTVFRKKQDGGRSLPTDIGATVGLVDTAYLGAEAGVDLKEQSDYPLYFNAKLQIKEDSVASFFPAVAIGVYEVGTESDKTNFDIVYALVAKNFPVVGRFSVGYYVGNDKLLLNASGEKENDGVLASYDRTLAEIDDRLWFAIDYMGGDNELGALSFGLSWHFSEQVTALLGYDVYNDDKVAGKDTVTIQFEMDF